MYEAGRFFALTGNTIGSSQIQSLDNSDMKHLYEFLFGKEKVIDISNYQDKPINDLSISEIINRMLLIKSWSTR